MTAVRSVLRRHYGEYRQSRFPFPGRSQHLGTLHRSLNRRRKAHGRPNDRKRIGVRSVSHRIPLVGSPQARLAAHAGPVERIDRTCHTGTIRDTRDRPVTTLSTVGCSPDGIRTHATAVRGRRPRPLDDGARTDPSCQHNSHATRPTQSL